MRIDTCGRELRFMANSRSSLRRMVKKPRFRRTALGKSRLIVIEISDAIPIDRVVRS